MTRAQHILAYTCFALWAFNADAQAPDVEWQRCLGGSHSEYSWGIQPTTDGGYAVLGTTYSTDGDVSGNHGAFDFWLAKLDSMGVLQWQRCYGGTGSESAKGLLATSDGGFLMVGTTGSMDGDAVCANTASHAWALKVDSVGGTQWQVCLGSDPDGSSGAFTRAVETEDGGYLVVGGTGADSGIWHENHGQTDFFAVKLSGNGQVEWLHCYGGSESDSAFPVRATPDGGFVIAGVTTSTDGQVTTGDHGQIWTIKIDADGNLLWNRRMGGSSVPGMGQEARDLVVNPDGSVLVVATVGTNDGDISGNHGDHDVWLVLLDGQGTIVQQRCFGGSGWENAWGAVATAQGRYAVAGYTHSNDGDVSGYHGGGSDAWVFTVDAGLDMLWQKCLGGSEAEAAFAIARSAGGELAIAGYTNSNDGDVSGLHPPGADDIWAVGLAREPETGIQGQELTAFSVFPSLASDIVNVSLPGALPASSEVDVLDGNGRVVRHERLTGKPGTIRIDVTGWATGLYCIRLNLGNAIHNARFLKR